METWRDTLTTSKMKYPDGKILTITTANDKLTGINYNNSATATYAYTNDMLSTVTNGNGTVETYGYNNWRKLESLNTKKSGTVITDYGFTYTRAFHLDTKTDKKVSPVRTENYDYDSYYRLKSVNYGNGTSDTFKLDGTHNIRQSTERGSSITWDVDGLNRLKKKNTTTYTYDFRNNMTQESGGKTYIYDDLNRLVEVKSGATSVATYTYDAFNRRVIKKVGTTTSRYTYNDWNIVEDSISSTNYRNYVDAGMDDHIMMEQFGTGAGKYYFHTDERGNVTAVTNSSGTAVATYRYSVYGELLSSTGTIKIFLWGGSYLDSETGNYWMRNRYYHIGMKRFINQDPIGLWGDANNLGNGFAYVAGMVTEHSDPTGLWDQQTATDINSDPTTRPSGKELLRTGYDGFASLGKGIKEGGGNPFTTIKITLEEFIKRIMERIKENEEKMKNSNNEEEVKRLRKENEKLKKELKKQKEKEEKDKKGKDEKDEKDEKDKKDEKGKKMPSDPDDGVDMNQKLAVAKLLAKMLHKEDENKEYFVPAKDPDNPYAPFAQFFRNPYFREKDPVKAMLKQGDLGNGVPLFMRNPLARPEKGSKYGGNNTAQEIVNSPFNPGNIDPWYE